MKIKRYTAVNMRLALAQVREEQGPDAVIMSCRRLDEGVEVIAAVDYDETLIGHVSRRSEPASEATPVSSGRSAPTVARAADAAVREPEAAGAAGNPPERPIGDGPYAAMRHELQDMRRLLEGSLADIAWSGTRSREPLKARVLEDLTALDIAPDVAMQLAARTPKAMHVADPARLPLALLAKSLPLAEDSTCTDGGVVAVVGPTGAGKTTTIAKLAARWCMRHGADEVALVSTDSYRIGAREQLSTFARILGMPMHWADGGEDLARLLARLRHKRLVLIDTAGFAPRDVRLKEQIGALRAGAPRARCLLALPAQGEAQALESAAVAFGAIAPAACILTKIDEAASLGAALSTAVRHALPIAYLCNGQRVPEDLHAAHRRRVWLVRAASRLTENAPSRRGEAWLARAFGGVPAHA